MDNPQHELWFWDDDAILACVREFGDEVLNAYLCISERYGPALADIGRYCILYEHGGTHIDIKSACKLKEMNKYKPWEPLMFTTWGKGNQSQHIDNDVHCVGEVCNWNLTSQPNHEIWKKS